MPILTMEKHAVALWRCFRFFSAPIDTFFLLLTSTNKTVLEPNVSPHRQIVKDDDVKECISMKKTAAN